MAGTPSPSPWRQLWRLGGGSTGTSWWSLESGVLACGVRGRHRGTASSDGAAGTSGDDRACGAGVAGRSECELQVVVPPSISSAADADSGAGGEPRAFVTWEDVRVTVAGGGTRGSPDVRILDGISGHARPGEVLAIIGPSGGGKTTLLDTLAATSRCSPLALGRVVSWSSPPVPVYVPAYLIGARRATGQMPASTVVDYARVGGELAGRTCVRGKGPPANSSALSVVAMAGTPSPLPRWAPTPSPSRPLWRRWGGGTPDANHHHHPAAGGVGTGWWSLVSGVFTWGGVGERRHRGTAPSSDGAASAGDDRASGCELQTVVVPSSAVADAGAGDAGDPRAFLTWEDVRVTVAGAGPRGAPDVKILDGISGHARPGEVLAIMGPSGGGKTTLLDTLAGRLGPGMNKTGLILINGRQEKLAYGTSAYVTQDNVLMSTLSVREAVYYSAQLQLPDTMPLPEKRAHAERVIREMGLADAMDTRIGGRITKGISGGQQKRLSICIEMLTRPRLLFLDEPTSGLDSAASYHVMSHIARVAARESMTVVAAVHQPSGDVFELFHGLCLLAAGRTVFFGTISDANEFFTLNGFPCPHLRSPSDHFLRTINKDFDEETVESSKTSRKTAAEAIDILATAYRSSSYYEKTTDQIVQMKNTDGASFRRREQASFATKLLVLTRRSFLNMHRDIGYYWMRLAIYLGIGICLGTIFYQVGYSYSSIQSRCSIIMYTVALLTFMAIGGFPSFVEDVKVFRKERLSGHYGVSEFVISNTLSATPYLSVIAVLPGAMLYYLTGLTKGVDHFIYFVLVVCMCCLLVESMMMVIAAIVPDFLMGIIVGAGVQGVMMLNGGFFRLPNELPKPIWKYPSYYISFHKYAVQGLYKNEFIGLSFPSDQLVQSNTTISGFQVLKDKLEVEMGYSKWVNLAILCGMMVLYRMMFFAIVKITEEIRQKRGGKRGCVR